MTPQQQKLARPNTGPRSSFAEKANCAINAATFDNAAETRVSLSTYDEVDLK